MNPLKRAILKTAAISVVVCTEIFLILSVLASQALADRIASSEAVLQKPPVNESSPGSSPKVRAVVQTGHRFDIEGVRFTEDASLMISWDTRHIFKIWSTDEWSLLATWKASPEYFRFLTIDAAGHVVGFDQKYIYEMDLLTGRVCKRSPNVKPTASETQKDEYPKRSSKLIEKSGPYYDISIRDASGNTVKKQISFDIPAGAPHDDPPDMDDIAVSLAGTHLAISGQHGYWIVSNAGSHYFPAPNQSIISYPVFLRFDPTGSCLIAKDHIYDVTEIRCLPGWRILLSEASFRNGWISPNGRWLVSTHAIEGGSWLRYTAHTLYVLDRFTGKPEKPLHTEASWILDMAISGDGRFLAVVDETSAPPAAAIRRTISLYDLFAAKRVWRLSGLPEGIDASEKNGVNYGYWQSKFNDCILSEDGSRLMVQSENGSVFVWRTQDMKLIYHNLRNVSFNWRGWAMDLVGRRLASAGDPGSPIHLNTAVYLIDVDTGTTLGTFDAAADGGVLHVCFSPDGKYVAAVSDNRTTVALAQIAESTIPVKYKKVTTVWDIDRRKMVDRIVDNENNGVFPLAFSDDSKNIRCGPAVYAISGHYSKNVAKAQRIMGNPEVKHFWVHSQKSAFTPGAPLRAVMSDNMDGIDIQEIASGRILAVLYALPEGVALIGSDGSFTGDGVNACDIHFVFKTSIYPFGQFRESLYRNHLLMGMKPSQKTSVQP